MPHASVSLRPGVNEVSTPTLNQAGISSSNLVRFMPDVVLGGIIQKLGGWTKFFPNTIVAIPRALWAWEDTNIDAHLAVGTENIGITGEAQLSVITNGSLVNVTPRSGTDNVTPAATSIAGNAPVEITDATTPNITDFDTVYIETHLSIGGLILFGLYQCTASSSTTYFVTATDTLGNPLPAPSSSSSPTVAVFDTTSGSNVVQVTLADNGYVVGSTYPVLVSTTVGGVTLFGNYIVQSIISSSQFTIYAQQNATSSTTGAINGGNARYVYSFAVGAPTLGGGFGIGGFGVGGFGVGGGGSGPPSLGSPIAADDWTLDNWGDVLISCPVNNTLLRPVYQYNPLSGDPIASIIPEAPPLNDGIFVAMPQRQIVAWGSTFTGIQDPLLIRYCDANNYNSWIATTTNQAGSYRIPRGSKIVGGIQAPQQGLIWTDIDLWAMQYTGPPYVYSFNEIGSGCGLIGRKAAASFNGTIYWMGFSQFFMLTGDGVSALACPVWDVVYQDLDISNAYKIRTAVNSLFNEISWYYPTLSSGGEVTSYVKYNIALGVWDYGTLGRSAWIDQSVLGPPIGADPATLYIYQHETSTDADGQPLLASFRTGYYTMSEADVKMFVDQVWPDMKWGYYGGTQNATVNLTFYVADYAGQTPVAYGPYVLTQGTDFITPRFRGRLVSIEIASSDTGSWWRLGNIRYRLAEDGKF